ncbi:hypothetical protein Micbo1qcDRAFT_10720 [Microdochium bolleyi]|uniref:Copper-fist domain-containing protein n=1 Tax=Microdochium bolleyi TaxID=196109 RepID=A0A136IXU2_9PEZI|nr:hypothetical protein Micbo1qcDRAFT_10720 [Microdochium bolleyi]
MPVINGVKMACAPCIRGHRSTKCAHHDRVMIAVKKPGRPLSTCPHAPGIQCGCGGVQAAIPIQHHGCRPPTTTGNIACHEVTVKTEDDAAESVVQSPTRSTQRVKKAKSNGHARKQSIDPSALERMNPSSLNIITPMGAPSFPSVDEVANMSNGPSTNGSPMSSNISVSPIQKPRVLADRATNPHHKENTTSPPAAGSCCSSRRPPMPVALNASQGPAPDSYNGTQPRSAETYLQNGSAQQSTPSSGGCCSSKPPVPADLPPATLASPQPLPMTAYPQQLQHISQASPVMYTPTPINGVGYWPSPMPQQVAPQTNGYVYMNHMAPQYPPAYQVYAPSTAMGAYPVMTGLTAEQHAQINNILGRPMQCHCGDVCECLGCIDHPFNSRTRDYVASAINAQQDWTKNGEDDATSPEDVHSSEASSTMPSPAGDALITDQMLPQQQQAMASDYLVFNYSYGCLGEPEHCPCGDDCACVGCTIHGGSSNVSASNGIGAAGPSV